ncbi:hypothetical protein [Lebetimonas sp. JS032]|uniref:hypothetical protein n=1 Tax=Lebetimonas sp. JS032 TaxID=990070 RepID=UPI0004B364AE|nr:hypothetical protein [Lebetimonas sp. JS032]
MIEKLKYIYILFCFIVPAVYYGIEGNFKVSSLLLIGVAGLNYLEKKKDLVDKFF